MKERTVSAFTGSILICNCSCWIQSLYDCGNLSSNADVSLQVIQLAAGSEGTPYGLVILQANSGESQGLHIGCVQQGCYWHFCFYQCQQSNGCISSRVIMQ